MELLEHYLQVALEPYQAEEETKQRVWENLCREIEKNQNSPANPFYPPVVKMIQKLLDQVLPNPMDPVSLVWENKAHPLVIL